MAEQSITLQPGESKVVTFEAIPHEGKAYQVAVNGLTGSFVAIEPPPAEFVYASDIRQQPIERGIKFEVDIKNIGGTAASCSATAWMDTCYGKNTVPMGTKTIAPGETVTFSGQYYAGWMTESDEWWRTESIISEAGAISFRFGSSLYLVSVEIPPEIVSGSEYWATQVIHLPFTKAGVFGVMLRLKNTMDSTPASEARIGDNAYGFTNWDIPLTATMEYIIKGVRGKAAVANYHFRWAYHPLPSGLYRVLSSVRWVQILGPTEEGYGGPCWTDYVVGQVKVV